MNPTDRLTRVGEQPDLANYDHVLLFLFGGKDSIACLDAVLAAGATPARIELHHHDVDGGGPALMDWPITAAYCRARPTASACRCSPRGKKAGSHARCCAPRRPDLVTLALSNTWDRPIRIEPGAWTLPGGAFGEKAGPS